MLFIDWINFVGSVSVLISGLVDDLVFVILLLLFFKWIVR